MLWDAQVALDRRYTALAQSRKLLGYPVYALEHGFDEREVHELRIAASRELSKSGLKDNHWLVWTALAAEAGYGYSGEEYWPALELSSGEWRSNSDRNRLREFYCRFTSRYGGPVTVGRWAKQFSNIAGPIANAVLPKYLQSLFAHCLYQQRFELAHRSFNQNEIGEFLFARYDGSSSRLRDFLQQTDLTSRIVLALREQDTVGTNERILPEILARIVQDLESERESRGYFRETRALIAEGVVRASSSLQFSVQTSTPQAVASESKAKYPQLVATLQGDDFVQLGVILPDINSYITGDSTLIASLARGRFRFPGPNARFMPAVGLITKASQKTRLEEFPIGQFIAFDDGAPELRAKLGPIYRFDERQCWVLCRTTNGTFKELFSGNVRGGETYLVIRRTLLPLDQVTAAKFKLCRTDTSEAYVYLFEAPELFTHAYRESLAIIGIGTELGARVEPVGLNPRNGDLPAWLLMETPTLRISSGQESNAYAVSLNGQSPTRLFSQNGDLFIALKNLSVGIHNLTVSIASPSGQIVSRSRSANFQFAIKLPEPWPDVVRQKAGFRLILEPVGASLDNLFEGVAKLQVLGPAGRTVQWSIDTFDASGRRSAGIHRYSTRTESPFLAIASVLERLRTHDSSRINGASRVDIVGSIDELGRQVLTFPHVAQPLRWIIDPQSGRVRLIDETDHQGSLTIKSYCLSQPMKRRIENMDAALRGLELTPPGMLVVASLNGSSTSLLACARHVQPMNSFSDLGLLQRLSPAQSAVSNLLRLVATHARWSKARAVGDLAYVRKRKTLQLIEEQIAIVACGSNFSREIFSGLPDCLLRAQGAVGGSPGFGLRMRTEIWSRNLDEDLIQFNNYANRYGIENEVQWCEAALTLAYNYSLVRKKQLLCGKFIGGLLNRRHLLRGAFLARAAAFAEDAQEG